MSFALLSIASSAISFASEIPAWIAESFEVNTLSEIRAKIIQGWDTLLTWSFSSKIHPYPLAHPIENLSFQVLNPELLCFEKYFGFFSVYHPLAGVVTHEKRDIEIAQYFLNEIHRKIHDPIQRQFASDEFLAKVFAYRTLPVGCEIQIGQDSYFVEKILNLWHGMPAFGLVAKENTAPPILLFRGTDLTLTKERGWASILSDLDLHGPGYRTFFKARSKIEEWLKEKTQAGTPARVVGFSLGGSFVLYSLVEMPHLINREFKSTAFNPPGIPQEIAERWQMLPAEEKPPNLIYLYQGDLVSQIGTFFSSGFEVSQGRPMQVIEAHVTVMGLQPDCNLYLLGSFIVNR